MNLKGAGVESRINSPLIIEEEDGSPRNAVFNLKFPNDSLQQNATFFNVFFTSNTSGRTAYIQNTNVLQSGSTFFVTSGTVLGVSVATINVSENILLDGVRVSTLGFFDMQDGTTIFNLNPGNIAIGARNAINKLDVYGDIRSTGAYRIGEENSIAFSSVPVMHASGFNSTLGSGATFSAFIPDSDIRLRRITVAIVAASALGAGDNWFCGSEADRISVISPNAAAAGTVFSSGGSADISAGTTVYFRMNSGAITTPTGNINCEYIMR